MTTWDGGDDLDDPLEPPRDFRDEVEDAVPEPVTDAMITPRTQPMSSADDDGDQTCRVCGESNDPRASYCLACGVRLSEPAEESPADPLEWIDEDPEPIFDASAGLLDPDEMDELTSPADREADVETPPPPKEPRITGRHILIALIGAAIAVLLFVTFQSASEPEVTTTTIALEDPSVMEAYLTTLDDLAGTVVELEDEAVQINTDWDDRVEDYETTLTRLTSLAARAAAVPDLVGGLEPPTAVSATNHRAIENSALTLSEAADEMVAGLEAPDTGEARRAALSKFEAAAAEFGTRVRTVGQPAVTTTAG